MTGVGPTGIHGKVPARGDFVTRNMPRSFVAPWDGWLQAGMAASREHLGEGWLSVYLESPVWRFVLAAGVCGPESWAGVLMPSVDRVGRYFPLTIAEPLSPGAHPLVTAVTAAPWFECAETLALRALEDDRLDLERFVDDVATLATAPSLSSATAPVVAGGSDAAGWCVDLETASTVGLGLTVVLDRLLVDRGQPYSLWWTNGGGRVPGHCCVQPHLPSIDRFHHLLTGTMTVAPGPAH